MDITQAGDLRVSVVSVKMLPVLAGASFNDDAPSSSEVNSEDYFSEPPDAPLSWASGGASLQILPGMNDLNIEDPKKYVSVPSVVMWSDYSVSLC